RPCHKFRVKTGARHRPQREALGAAVAGGDAKPVIDEIENDIERACGANIRRGSEPARIHPEGDVPPVIDERRRGEARLARDLRKAVERLAGLAPRRKRQFRPTGIPGHRTPVFDTRGEHTPVSARYSSGPAGHGSTDHWQISVSWCFGFDVPFTG